MDRIEYPKGNFDCAMLVNDLRSTEHINPHEFLVVLFTANACSEPACILKFNRPSDTPRKQGKLVPWSFKAYPVRDIGEEE